MSNTKPIIKPFYTSSEIASFIGYTAKGTRGLLFKMNIPLHLIGNKFVVFLSDLQTHAPEFYSSILEANNLNSIINKNSPVEDEDEYTQNQFTK